MAVVPQAKQMTFDDFCVMAGGKRKGDLIDGVVYLTPPDAPATNELFTWLLSLIDFFVEEKGLGQVDALRVAFRLDDWNAPEPDIGFIGKPSLRRVRPRYVDGPPDLAVEVVSPESLERDYRKKRVQYQRAGVPEYWIVDDVYEKVTLLRLTSRGAYRTVRPRQGVLHSRTLPGFWLRPAWLWQDPRPDELEILKQILAGKP